MCIKKRINPLEIYGPLQDFNVVRASKQKYNFESKKSLSMANSKHQTRQISSLFSLFLSVMFFLFPWFFLLDLLLLAAILPFPILWYLLLSFLAFRYLLSSVLPFFLASSFLPSILPFFRCCPVSFLLSFASHPLLLMWHRHRSPALNVQQWPVVRERHREREREREYRLHECLCEYLGYVYALCKAFSISDVQYTTATVMPACNLNDLLCMKYSMIIFYFMHVPSSFRKAFSSLRSILLSFVPSAFSFLHPSSLSSFLSSFLPCFLLSFLPSFLLWFLFLPSFLPFFLPSFPFFLPSFLSSFLSSFLPSFLSFFLSSILPFFRPFFPA